MTKPKTLILSIVGLVIAGCGGSQQRKEGLAELQRLQSAVHKLNIVVSAGVTKQEYSQRLADALLEAGDLDQSAKQTIAKFPKSDQPTAGQTLTHLGEGLEAYKAAKEFLGDKYLDEITVTTLTQHDYELIKTEFPGLDELQPDSFTAQHYPDSPPEYRRRDMVQALWKFASSEDSEAKQLIDQLRQK
jgi:hypothetical protein